MSILSAQTQDFLISPNYRLATNPTTINNYVHRGGQSGQSGEIPISELLAKMEQTCMYENENQLDDHNRRTLKDRTPEAPTMASDLTRRDRHSAEILSIRHNMSRTAEEPFHPDLNLSFTERDTRGIASEPNMRLLALQGGYRTKYKDFVNDNLSDMQSTGGTRSNETIIKDFRSTVSGAKKRWNWFATSRDGRANRSNMSSFSTNKRSDASKVIFNQPNLRVNEASQATRDAVTKISNALPIGSRSTASHRFEIADYSQIRSTAPVINNDFRKIMDEVEADQDETQSKEDTTRSIAYVMSTTANKDIEFDSKIVESFNEQDRKTSVTTGNIRNGYDNAECSEMNPANMIFQHYMQKPQSRTTICKDRLSRIGEIDKTQLALIREMKNNKSQTFHFDPHIAWETEKDQTAARVHKTYVYKTAANIPARRVDVDDLEETQMQHTSNFTQDRSTPHNLTIPGGSRDVDATANWTNATYKDRKGAPLGKKNKVRYYSAAETIINQIGDMDTPMRKSSAPPVRGLKRAIII